VALIGHGVADKPDNRGENAAADAAANDLRNDRPKIEAAGCVGRSCSAATTTEKRVKQMTAADAADRARNEIPGWAKVKFADRVREKATAASAGQKLYDKINKRCTHCYLNLYFQ
jgi:hypothetical protein